MDCNEYVAEYGECGSDSGAQQTGNWCKLSVRNSFAVNILCKRNVYKFGACIHRLTVR